MEGRKEGRQKEKHKQPTKNKEERNNEELSRYTGKKECRRNLEGGQGGQIPLEYFSYLRVIPQSRMCFWGESGGRAMYVY